MKLLLLSLSVLTLIGCSAPAEMTPRQNSIFTAFMADDRYVFLEEGDSEINLPLKTSVELSKAYLANEVGASSEFKNKELRIKGKIENISLDFTNTPYLVLGGADMFNKVHAQFSKETNLGQIKKGQLADLVCKPKNFIIGSVIMEDCQFAGNWFDAKTLEIKKKVAYNLDKKTFTEYQSGLLTVLVMFGDQILPENYDCSKNQKDCISLLAKAAKEKKYEPMLIKHKEQLKALKI